MTKKVKTGFALLSPERLREIASSGGSAVPGHKRTFSTDRSLATSAGRKGGASVPAGKRAFKNLKLAASAGRKGGMAVIAEKRAFAVNRELASRAGAKGGRHVHGIFDKPSDFDRREEEFNDINPVGE